MAPRLAYTTTTGNPNHAVMVERMHAAAARSRELAEMDAWDRSYAEWSNTYEQCSWCFYEKRAGDPCGEPCV